MSSLRRGMIVRLVVMALSFVSPASANAQLIGCNWDTGVFYSVSTTNGALVQIANPGITGLAEIQRAPNGTLYGMNTGVGSTLFQFDSITYAATAIGSLGEFVGEGGMAFSPTGSAFGIGMGFDAALRLFTINLATGAGTSIGVVSGGLHDINGLAFRSDGMLIGLDRVSNSLLIIDPANATSSTLAPISATVGAVGGMTVFDGVGYFSTSGFGFLPGSNQLFSFDMFTGQQTLIGSFASTITPGSTGISGLTGVPEPSSVVLLGLAVIFVPVSRLSSGRFTTRVFRIPWSFFLRRSGIPNGME